MARMNVGAATAAHRAHQAGASCAGSLAAHRLTFTGLTVRIWTPPQTQETDRIVGRDGCACSRISGICGGPV